jgi:PAS domain S-box-containing protein
VSWWNESIVRRLVATTVLAGLLTGLVGVLLVRTMERRDLREEAASRNLQAAERRATLMDGRVDALLGQLQILATLPAVVAMEAAATADLAIALRVSEELDQLELYDRDGGPVAAAGSRALARPEELPERPVAAAVEDRVIRIVEADGLPALELLVPVQETPGTTTGTLVARAPFTLFTHEAEARLIGSGSRAFVTTLDGRIVDHVELDRVLNRDVFPLELFEGDDRTATLDDATRGRVLVAGARFASVPGWIVVEQREDDVVRAAQATVNDITVVLVAVVIAVMGTVIVVGRRLLRPLSPLGVAVERLGRGEHGARATAAGTRDLARLADGFNRMAASLEQREDELRAAERSARDSEERLRLMVEGVEDYAIVLLDLDGRIRSWNTGARRLVGTDAEHAVGRSLDVFLDPEHPPRDPVVSARAYGRGESEGWYRRADGERFWASIVVTALQDEDDEPYGYAAVIHDMTERHRVRRAMEDALRRERQASNELRHANELKDEFLAVAAHEIRTPLSAILGAANILSRDWDDLDESDKVRFRDMIESHAEDMRQMVNRLLDFTRLQAGRARIDPTPVDLRAELERYVELLGRHLDGHEVQLDIPAATLHTDRDALQHIITNLLSNAAKFSPPGSPITVTGSVEDDSVVLHVTDSGIGIDHEDQQLIFEVFRQSDHGLPTARGTGVGLAIVKRYVQLLGGRVQVTSAPGEGSTFTVAIPNRMAAV